MVTTKIHKFKQKQVLHFLVGNTGQGQQHQNNQVIDWW